MATQRGVYPGGPGSECLRRTAAERSPCKIISALALLLAVSSLHAETPAPSAEHKIKIVLVGDSTVTDTSGWGLGFKRYLNEKAECRNTSRGGRSSMSFMKEGLWTNALALKGDYYLIQFGHNNEPGKPGRSTDMPTFIADMTRYVDEALAIGARPVLVTPLVRRQWDKTDPGKIKSSLAPYAAEVRKIAADKHVPLIDLHDRSKELCESFGREKCFEFSPVKITDGTNTFDGTHLTNNGALLFARLVVEELRKSAPELAAVLRDEPAPASSVTAESYFDVIVAADGSGAFTNVQAAIAAAPTNRARPYVILIKPGTYKEHLAIPTNKPFITFRGEPGQAAGTLLTDDHNVNTLGTEGAKLSTPDSATVLVQASDFAAENITFENTAGNHGQALAMYVVADRAIFRNCRFLGWQDTLRADAPRGGGGARQYFDHCEIVGHVDFIYAAGTAVFDRCHIHCLADGYITAASTAENHRFGYVFLDCRVTAAPSIKGTYLGRPWRPFAAVAFLRTEMPEQIRPEGWHNWGKADNEKTARYAEYKNTGPGAKPDARVPWSKQLTDDEAKDYTVENILAGSDGWDPKSSN
jgi:pectinesterase